jgi:hypothetical protein
MCERRLRRSREEREWVAKNRGGWGEGSAPVGTYNACQFIVLRCGEICSSELIADFQVLSSGRYSLGQQPWFRRVQDSKNAPSFRRGSAAVRCWVFLFCFPEAVTICDSDSVMMTL